MTFLVLGRGGLSVLNNHSSIIFCIPAAPGHLLQDLLEGKGEPKPEEQQCGVRINFFNYPGLKKLDMSKLT